MNWDLILIGFFVGVFCIGVGVGVERARWRARVNVMWKLLVRESDRKGVSLTAEEIAEIVSTVLDQ